MPTLTVTEELVAGFESLTECSEDDADVRHCLKGVLANASGFYLDRDDTLLDDALLLANIALGNGEAFDEERAEDILLHIAILADSVLTQAKFRGVELTPATRAGFELIKSARSDLWSPVPEATVANQGGSR
jgi:hypothetical protein